MKSWKTTLAAIIGILTAFGTFVLTPLMDADPATVPAWGSFFSVATTAIIGLVARDDTVSSKQLGIE